MTFIDRPNTMHVSIETSVRTRVGISKSFHFLHHQIKGSCHRITWDEHLVSLTLLVCKKKLDLCHLNQVIRLIFGIALKQSRDLGGRPNLSITPKVSDHIATTQTEACLMCPALVCLLTPYNSSLGIVKKTSGSKTPQCAPKSHIYDVFQLPLRPIAFPGWAVSKTI